MQIVLGVDGLSGDATSAKTPFRLSALPFIRSFEKERFLFE